MKREIYITILLFAFMIFALISTMVRGEQLDPVQHTGVLTSRSININISIDAKGVGIDKFHRRINKANYKRRINSSVSLTTFNRGLQVVNWSSRSLFVLLHSRGLG